MSASSKKQGKPKRATSKAKSKVKATKTKKVEKKAPSVEKPKIAATAPKPKKTVEKKEAPPKAAAKAPPVKMGSPPMALVAVRHIDSLHERAARGFSFGELTSAGIPLNAAKRTELSLDIRRRSVVDRNVEALKGWFKSPGQASAKSATVAVAAVGKKK